jgi:hypothetical protein
VPRWVLFSVCRPRDIADIKLAHPPSVDGWLQHSRDGRYVYVGLAGDVIDTRTRKIVAFLPPLQQTAKSSRSTGATVAPSARPRVQEWATSRPAERTARRKRRSAI